MYYRMNKITFKFKVSLLILIKFVRCWAIVVVMYK